MGVKMFNIQLFEVTFRCEGEYRPREPDRFIEQLGISEPGTPPYIKGFTVYLGYKDVTKDLPQEQYQYLYDQYMEELFSSKESV
jgi:hypothetical protein